jgi:hypothetical protein
MGRRGKSFCQANVALLEPWRSFLPPFVLLPLLFELWLLIMDLWIPSQLFILLGSYDVELMRTVDASAQSRDLDVRIDEHGDRAIECRDVCIYITPYHET